MSGAKLRETRKIRGILGKKRTWLHEPGPQSLHVEIFYGVLKGNFLHHAAQKLHIHGDLPFFGPSAQEVAEDSAEVVMAGIGDEAAGIRQHAHKAAKKSQVGLRDHLFLHAVLLIVEPPAGTHLDLHLGFIALERAG